MASLKAETCSCFSCNKHNFCSTDSYWLLGAFAILRSAAIGLRLKRDGTRAETRFRLSAKRTSAFKSAGASVQSTAGSRGVRISVSNAGYTMFQGSVTSTGYPLYSPVSPSLPLPCVTVYHHISTGLYFRHFCSPVRLSARNNSATIGRISMKFCFSVFLENLSREFNFRLILHTTNRYFTWRPICILGISLICY